MNEGAVSPVWPETQAGHSLGQDCIHLLSSCSIFRAIPIYVIAIPIYVIAIPIYVINEW